MEFTKSTSKEDTFSVPLPMPDAGDDLLDDGEPYSERRIWIGNIDVTLAEYAVLQLVQPFGELEKFDYVYHRAPGPNKGEIRLLL